MCRRFESAPRYHLKPLIAWLSEVLFFIGAVMFFYFGNFFSYNGCSFLPLENGFFQLSDLEFPTFYLCAEQYQKRIWLFNRFFCSGKAFYPATVSALIFIFNSFVFTEKSAGNPAAEFCFADNDVYSVVDNHISLRNLRYSFEFVLQ